MVMLRISGLALIGSLLVAGSAAAQTVDEDTSGISATDSQHIEALYQAQQPADGFEGQSTDGFEGQSATDTLTRDEIAAYRSDSGWGKAFKDMRADGYFEGYKNFGQVVSGAKSDASSLGFDGAKVEANTADGVKIYKAAKVRRPHRVTRLDRPSRPNRPNRPSRPRIR
jgi:hypothetical protein